MVSADEKLFNDFDFVRELHFEKFCRAMSTTRPFTAGFFNLTQAQNPFSKVPFIEFFLADDFVDIL